MTAASRPVKLRVTGAYALPDEEFRAVTPSAGARGTSPTDILFLVRRHMPGASDAHEGLGGGVENGSSLSYRRLHGGDCCLRYRWSL
jgi:hypothetical protein